MPMLFQPGPSSVSKTRILYKPGPILEMPGYLLESTHNMVTTSESNLPTAYFIETERLAFRELNALDANERYYAWLNDPEINQYLENRYFPSTIESIREYINSINASKANLFCAIILKENNQHIGNIKLGPINWIHRYAEIGLLLGEKNCWGKGFATEAI